MSFEAFEVHLYPRPDSRVRCTEDLATVKALVNEVQTKWPQFRLDEVEITRMFEPLRANEALLVYETSEGLIQLGIRLERAQSSVVFSLRFAYCNPVSVYEPFCNMVEWLMRCYGLYCHVVPDLAPKQQGLSDNIASAESVRAILVPSMDYNRQLWKLDANSEEEAILRPGEAVERFIVPRFVSTS